MTLGEVSDERIFYMCLHFPPAHKETVGARIASCTSDGKGVLWDKQRKFRWERPADMWKKPCLCHSRDMFLF